MEKSYCLFVEGTRVMLSSRLAYKNMLSLQHCIHCLFNLPITIHLIIRILLTIWVAWAIHPGPLEMKM